MKAARVEFGGLDINSWQLDKVIWGPKEKSRLNI